MIENAMAMVSSCIRRRTSSTGSRLTIDSDDGLAADLQMQIGRASLDCDSQQLVDIHCGLTFHGDPNSVGPARG